MPNSLPKPHTFQWTVPERILPCLWNECWWSTDQYSPLSQWKTSPAPLRTQPSQPSPAAWTWCQSPPRMHKPVPDTRTEQAIASEPKPHKMSDQECEAATSCATVGLLVKFEGMEEDPAHSLTTEGELLLTSVTYDDLEEDVCMNLQPPLVPSSSKSPVPLMIPSSSKSPVPQLVPSSSKSPVSQLLPPSSKSPVSPELPPSLPIPPPLLKSTSLL